MTGLYHPGDTVVHRLPAAIKVLAVFAGGTLLFLTADPRAITGALVGVLTLFAVARVPWRVAVAQLRPAAAILAAIAVAQWVTVGPLAALVVCLRLATLISLAALVTSTTRVSAMVEVIERALRPLRHVGVQTERISLAISLALRFIPLLTQIVSEVRDAQRARGLDRSVVALAVPVLVRALHTADQVADAIDARSGGV